MSTKKYKTILENVDTGQYDPNLKGYSNGSMIGFYGQNQEKIDNKKVFDFRKKLEFSHDGDINDRKYSDLFCFNTENSQREDVLDEIAKWLYKKILFNVDNLAEGFEKIYWFVLNNTQEIYEIFGKSLDDEERKIVLTKSLDILNNRLKDVLTENILKSCHNKSQLVDFATKNGISLNEAFVKIMERAPKNPKAEKFIKKSKSEFKKRYGDRWKEVLYATAWKMFGESDNSPENTENTEVAETKSTKMFLRRKDLKKRKDSKYLKIRNLRRILKPLFKHKVSK